MKPSDIALEKGLPGSVDTERLLLGAIILSGANYVQVSAALTVDDFSIEPHRRIFARMGDIYTRGDTIDRVTLAAELSRQGQVDSVGGLSYLVSLDEGLPELAALDSYIRIVKDKSTLRRIIALAQSMAIRCIDGEDSADVLAAASAGILDLTERSTSSTLLTPVEVIEREGGISRFLDRAERTGLSTGYRHFDVMSGGLKPGCLYILGARPRMGKTALALNIAENIAMNSDGAVAIFSLEMGGASLLNRMICSRAQVDTKRYDNGVYMRERDERERVQRAVSELVECDRLLIDDHAITNLQEIHSKIRQAKAKRKITLVILDYLQLLVGGDDRYRVAEVSRISRGLKVIAKDCGVPILALSQLSRECDKRADPRPVLSDLRDSGSIEQDADLVVFLYREEVYKPEREDLRGIAELIIAKQRDGAEGRITLTWRGNVVRFENAVAE